MDLDTFIQLARQGYNRIPLTRLVMADLDTPVSAYLKLAAGPYSYLFESVVGGEKWGRYSIIGLPCKTLLRVCGDDVSVETNGTVVEQHRCDDPLAFIESYQKRFNVPELPGLPAFFGGFVGYFGYDTVRYVEPKLKSSTPPDALQTPDILLLLSDEVLVFDNLAGQIHLICHSDVGEISDDIKALTEAFESAQNKLSDFEQRLQLAAPPLPALAVNASDEELHLNESDFKSGFTQPDYEAVVEKIKDYTLAGDVMQVVPSQRMQVPFSAPPINLYRALRTLNPSPYMYYLDMGDFYIVGSSPEILARAESGEVTVRPIAGTRRRGHNEEEDKAFEEELLADPKEIAEHLMLIDLGRNDVGRVAKIGSVELTEKMAVERYSHVMHIVSNVTGKLREEFSAIDVLRASLPAGTLSGAPKIRAMEIIDEVEKVKRGVYGGAVGYLSWSGNMDTAIAIRTAVIKDGVLNIQAGGGVVADSVPRLEWKETMNKARAMFRAAAIASHDSGQVNKSTDTSAKGV